MKRCPECGYFTKEDLRDCPLCGVRMRRESGSQMVQTHVHTEKGEQCLLPNTGERAPVRRPSHPAPEKKAKAYNPRRSSGWSAKSTGKKPNGAAIFALVVLFVILRACMG